MFWQRKSNVFPLLTPSLLLAGTSIYIIGKPTQTDPSTSILSYFKRSCNQILNYAARKREVPILPKQNAQKPVIIFDVKDLLIKKCNTLFSSKFYKRPYTNVFLFHLAHLYELILVSEMNANESVNLLQKIDPYGCISYRLFLSSKKEFKSVNLNRDLKKAMYIETNSFKDVKNLPVTKDSKLEHKNSIEVNSDSIGLMNFNKITVDKWNGKKDDKLLVLLDFFVKLRQKNINDYQKISKHYENKEFTNAYNKKQKDKFKKSHIFTWNINDTYNKSIEKINEERIQDFQRAKLQMDQHIKRDELAEKTKSLGMRIFNTMISML